MPFLTPASTMTPESKRNAVWQISGFHDDDTNSENIGDRSAAASRVKSNLKALTR